MKQKSQNRKSRSLTHTDKLLDSYITGVNKSLKLRLLIYKVGKFDSHSTFIEVHEGAVTCFLTLLPVQ